MSDASYAELLTQLAAELEAQPGTRLQLWWSEVGRFRCDQTGSCCRRPWKIHLSREYLDQWGEALSALAELPASGLFELEAESHPLRYAALAKQADGACIMLDANNLCKIHARWGADAKPEVCQRFPHSALQQIPPDYNSVFLAPSCRRAARMLSEPQNLNYRLIPTGQTARLTAIPLIAGRSLSRSAWLIWLGHVLDALLAAPSFGVWLGALGEELGRLLRLPAGEMATASLRPLAPAPVSATDPVQLRRLLAWLGDQLIFRHSAFAEARPWLEQVMAAPEQLRLAPAETLAIERYLQAYWLRQLLVPSQLLRGEVNLLQQMFFVGLQGTVLRLWAHYLRSRRGHLELDVLADAANQMYAYLAQAQAPEAMAPWRSLRPELCLIQLQEMGRWQAIP